MSTTAPAKPARPGPPAKYQAQRQGIILLAVMVAVMWIVEVINSIDSNRLDNDGILPRSVGHVWGILTAPFLHKSFGHLISNTVPFVFLGLIIALRGGVKRLALVTLIVIVLGGLGTWLISPSNSITVGASGVVFGYAGYLLARGFVDRSALDLVIGIVVGVIWGGALLTSLVPQYGISWQGHLCGGLAGIVAAFVLRRPRSEPAAPATAQ